MSADGWQLLSQRQLWEAEVNNWLFALCAIFPEIVGAEIGRTEDEESKEERERLFAYFCR